MKISNLIQEFLVFFTKKTEHNKNHIINHSIRTVHVSFLDIPHSAFLVIKKYGWLSFFYKLISFTVLFLKDKFKIITSEIHYLFYSSREIFKREGFFNLFKRLINYVLYGKGVLHKNGITKKQVFFTVPSIEKMVQKMFWYDIINFSVVDWDFRFQRPQQLCTQFEKMGNRVFYIATTCHPIKKSGLNKKEVSQFVSSRKVSDNIIEIHLATKNIVDIYKDTVNDREDMQYLKWSLEFVRENFDIRMPVMVLDLPFWYDLAREISEGKIVYDCMDDHSGFSTNSSNMLDKEQHLMKEAKLLVTTSSVLYENGKKINENTLLIKNAADVKHFSILPENDLLKDIKKPIIGYYGAISEWFDVDLVEYCAKKFPEYSFVLIGRVSEVDVSKLGALKNVHLLGEKPYKDLPEYLYHFDVCHIPFKIIPLTLATNPVKFYEYISSGKTVVSVDLPELKQYESICYLSKTYEEYANNIETALHERDTDLVQERIAVAKDNTWEQRAKTVINDWNKKLFPKISIVIVTYNNLHYTQACLNSLFRYTEYPNYEVIIVDNASHDETPEYLKKVEKENINVTVILNKENRGFAGGNNDGLRIAKGKYIVLLNNDTIVTEGWLSCLKSTLDSDEKLGIIGPISNSVGNIQMISVDYDDVKDMHLWAKKYTETQDTAFIPMKMVGFFCVMMKREVFDKIGYLDENFGVGMFEDDDYCERIIQAGYDLGYTKKVFIHHFGSASFKKLEDKKYREIWDRNKAYFEKKWNKKWVSNT